MRTSRKPLRAAWLIAACMIVTPAAAAGKRDPGLETLHPENGWAASGSGVTGGSAAVPAQIYTVSGALGAWNALYDAVSLRDTNNVWVDHNTFEDRTTADESQPQYFGVLYQVHDGSVDITNASDLVTVSWNRFRNHDKTMLIGSSDSAAADRGKLRVTLHHNWFQGVGQRVPRVRFGQVHLYNNYYDIRGPRFQYSWGVGIESAIYAEENFFLADRTQTADSIIERFNGTALSASGTLLVGPSVRNPVDVIAAWNSVNDPDLGFDAGWTPTLNYELLPAWTTPVVVPLLAGPMSR